MDINSLSQDSAFGDQMEDPRGGAPTHLIMIKWIVYPRIPHLMIKWRILGGGAHPFDHDQRDSLCKDSAFDDQMEDPRGEGAHPFDHDQMDSLSKDSAFDDQMEDPREGAHPFDHDQMDSLSKDSAFDDQMEDPRDGGAPI